MKKNILFFVATLCFSTVILASDKCEAPQKNKYPSNAALFATNSRLFTVMQLIINTLQYQELKEARATIKEMEENSKNCIEFVRNAMKGNTNGMPEEFKNAVNEMTSVPASQIFAAGFPQDEEVTEHLQALNWQIKWAQNMHKLISKREKTSKKNKAKRTNTKQKHALNSAPRELVFGSGTNSSNS